MHVLLLVVSMFKLRCTRDYSTNHLKKKKIFLTSTKNILITYLFFFFAETKRRTICSIRLITSVNISTKNEENVLLIANVNV